MIISLPSVCLPLATRQNLRHELICNRYSILKFSILFYRTKCGGRNVICNIPHAIGTRVLYLSDVGHYLIIRNILESILNMLTVSSGLSPTTLIIIINATGKFQAIL
jgi:hypothetical protein